MRTKSELREEIKLKIVEWQDRRRIEEGKIISTLLFGSNSNSIIEVGKVFHFLRSKGLHNSAVFHLTRNRRTIARSFELYCERYLKVSPNIINSFIILAVILNSRSVDGVVQGLDHYYTFKMAFFLNVRSIS